MPPGPEDIGPFGHKLWQQHDAIWQDAVTYPLPPATHEEDSRGSQQVSAVRDA